MEMTTQVQILTRLFGFYIALISFGKLETNYSSSSYGK